jgi:hypothetical protein
MSEDRIQENTSVSSMSNDALIHLSHTTLTRFINCHAEFWSKLDEEIMTETL